MPQEDDASDTLSQLLRNEKTKEQLREAHVLAMVNIEEIYEQCGWDEDEDVEWGEQHPSESIAFWDALDYRRSEIEVMVLLPSTVVILRCLPWLSQY